MLDLEKMGMEKNRLPLKSLLSAEKMGKVAGFSSLF